MPYQSIFKSGNIQQPTKSAPLAVGFTPGQYASVNSKIAASHAVAPPAAPKVQAATPPNGPTGFWNRIGQVGIGEVKKLDVTAKMAIASKTNNPTAFANADKQNNQNNSKIVKNETGGVGTLVKGAKAVGNFGVNTAKSVGQAAETVGKAAALLTPQAQKIQQKQQQISNNASAQLSQLHQAYTTGKINKSQYQEGLTKLASLNNQLSAQSQQTANEASPKKIIGSATELGTFAVPGGKEVAEGADLLKTFGTQGVKDLAEKAGVDITDKASTEAANEVAKTKVAQQAFKKASTTAVGRAAKSSAKGAVGFGAFGAAGEAGQGGTNKQIIKAGVTGAAEGTVAGAAGSLLKSAVKAKLSKTPTIEKGTAPKEDVTPSPVNKLGEKAEARNAFVGKKVVGGSQASESLATPKTKLLGTGGGKIEGKGFTATPTPDVTKVKLSARLNTINQKLDSVAQGKTTMASEDIKSLNAEKTNIGKVANGSAKIEDFKGTPGEIKVSTPKTTLASPSERVTTPNRGQSDRGSGGEVAETPTISTKPAKTTGLKPVKMEGKIAPSQLSVKVNARVVANKLSSDLGEAQEHGVMDIKDQARKATDLINTDEQKATDIATGKRNAPAGIHPHAVFVAVENRAIQDGNVDLLRQLAKSKRVDEATAAGQTLRVLRERDQESPVAAMQQVAKARSDAVEKRIGSVPKAITATTKDIDSHIKPVSKTNWQVFVESIKC